MTESILQNFKLLVHKDAILYWRGQKSDMKHSHTAVIKFKRQTRREAEEYAKTWVTKSDEAILTGHRGHTIWIQSHYPFLGPFRNVTIVR